VIRGGALLSQLVPDGRWVCVCVLPFLGSILPCALASLLRGFVVGPWHASRPSCSLEMRCMPLQALGNAKRQLHEATARLDEEYSTTTQLRQELAVARQVRSARWCAAESSGCASRARARAGAGCGCAVECWLLAWPCFLARALWGRVCRPMAHQPHRHTPSCSLKARCMPLQELGNMKAVLLDQLRHAPVRPCADAPCWCKQVWAPGHLGSALPEEAAHVGTLCAVPAVHYCHVP
jgi:hypothetical protein